MKKAYFVSFILNFIVYNEEIIATEGWLLSQVPFLRFYCERGFLSKPQKSSGSTIGWLCNITSVVM